MTKEPFSVKIPKELDKEFRKQVDLQNKKYNLALEEAMKLWIEKNKKDN